MSASLVLGALVLACGPATPGPAQDLEDGSRSVERRLPAEVAPELEVALLQVLEAEARIDQLSRPHMEDGRPTESPEEYERRLFGEGSELLAHLAAGFEEFDAYGKPMPPARVCADQLRFGAGYRAARGLVVSLPELEPEQLLALFTGEFVGAEPIWTGPEALEYQASEQQAGWLAPLGNGGALGYLTWGLLYQEDFWQERDRDGFVLQLLSRGLESRLVARTVRRALEPPMVPPRPASATGGKPAPGRTIAATMESLRGRVGFTKEHEQLLALDLAALELQEDEAKRSDRELPPDKRPVLDPAGRRVSQLSDQGYLETWLPMMLRLVRQELYRGGAPELMRRGATLKERLLYWNQLFREQGFAAGREAMLAEVAAILAGEDLHPLSPEIDQLLALRAATGLSPEQASRLEALTLERRTEQDSLIRSMSQILGMSGAGEHYELLVQTLAVDLSELLGELDPGRQRHLTEMAWMGPFAKGQPRAVQTLGDALDGQLELPDWTQETLILDLAAHPGYPGGPALLGQLVREGSLEELGTALQNSGWMTAGDLEVAGGRLFEAFEDPGASRYTRGSAGPTYLSALSRFPEPAVAKAKLLETFAAGYWKADQGFGAFGNNLSASDKAWLRLVLTDEERAELVQAGSLPGGVL
ncbi:MAG: hypothetical protein P1V81_09750 [Planctomycetota bacterium]|nr:hypothetical protein [Planctomycetota bacterium]